MQQIRKDILDLKRLPARDIFTSTTIFDQWAFHYGGRKELQFNIGLESINEAELIRFGVAFSLECSQSLPSIDVLIPKIALFNDYIQSYSERFAGMRMWHYQGDRSVDYIPSPIPPELIVEGTFIFLGVKQAIDNIDYDSAVKSMNRLLPLYVYTEINGETEKPEIGGRSWSFSFKPGLSSKASSANVSLAQRKLDINLRHNVIQEVLYSKLSELYGRENVGTEIPSGYDCSVDLIVRHKNQYWFYEIKTGHTAKACIRQAVGQLLEYSYWPGNQEASRLIIVGEPQLDCEARQYIETLKSKFSLPISYEAIEI